MENHSNFFVQNLGSNNHINLNFISTTTQFSQYHLHSPEPPWQPRPSILTFAAAVLVNFLELKYQGKNESPFETHSRTMYLAVGSLIAYCVAYDVKSRFNWRARVKNVCVFGGLMAVFGSVSLAALFSVLLPWLLSPVLFSLSVLFLLSQLSVFSMIRDEVVLPARLRRAGSVHPWRFLENVLVDDDERYILPL